MQSSHILINRKKNGNAVMKIIRIFLLPSNPFGVSVCILPF